MSIDKDLLDDARKKGIVLSHLLDIQSPAMSLLGTRLVVPLRSLTRVHVSVQIGDRDYIAVVSEMAAVPESVLGKTAGNAQSKRQELIDATDLLITGF